MDLRDLLRQEITRRGVSQANAAKEMGVSQPVLSRWLADPEQVPSTENCARVAQFVRQPLGVVLEMAGRVPPGSVVPQRELSDYELRRQARQKEIDDLLGSDESLWDPILRIAFAGKDALLSQLRNTPQKEARKRGPSAKQPITNSQPGSRDLSFPLPYGTASPGMMGLAVITQQPPL